ncbi:hypothetical protein IL306_003438 [Fusarium sp. DS 682]|nr:hypothetical protein IL306_003438 [Fusarium sp. DS 682]
MPRPKPLPDCEGPKLECFIDDITTCDFKLLGNLGWGCHSSVWKAEINDKVYAIKLFNDTGVKNPKFFLSAFDEPPPLDEDDEIMPLVPSDKMSQSTIDSLHLHATSFYNECRVFGRLKELGREDLAVKAYGYLQFDLNDEKVQQYFLPFGQGARASLACVGDKNPTDVDVIRHMLRYNDHHMPVMAIVKEWVPYDYKEHMPCKLTQREMNLLPRLLRNLHGLHKSGIVVRDLKDQQYLAGQLVDFSFAWTIPHIFDPESGLRPRWSFESMAAWDLICFQRILDAFNAKADEVPHVRKHKLVACRNEEVYERLRTRPQMYGPFLPMLVSDERVQPMKYRPRFDPAKFNWRAIQKTTNKASPCRVTKTKAPPKKRGKKKAKRGNKKTIRGAKKTRQRL